MRVALVVATSGRAAMLQQVALHWLRQTRPFERIVLSAPAAEDVAGLGSLSDRIEIVLGARGLCAQRNAALDRLAGSCPLAIFLDDDLVPSRRFAEGAADLFARWPDVMVASGTLLADGINTPGIDYRAAARQVAAYDVQPPPAVYSMQTIPHGYGCNLVARVGAAPELRFDERLPLYGWQEDLDFSRRLGSRGRIVRSDAIVGVHMGAKMGRASGVRLGYSQIANPVHLLRKQIMTPREAFVMASRNMIKNAVRYPWPEPWVDRRGRLRGNMVALWDAARGRLQPERVLDL